MVSNWIRSRERYTRWWRTDKAATVASPRQLADAYERARNETLPDLAADGHAGPKVDGKNSFADEAHLPL